MNKFFEIKCIDKTCFIKDLSIYNSVSYEISEKWSGKGLEYRLTLYYYNIYQDLEGYVSCDKESEIFYFKDKNSLLSTYESIKSILKGDI